jgi:hypothetical protein
MDTTEAQQRALLERQKVRMELWREVYIGYIPGVSAVSGNRANLAVALFDKQFPEDELLESL